MVIFCFPDQHLYHPSGANDLWFCFARGFMMMFVSLGIKANNGKQTEHCDLQCFFIYSLLELKLLLPTAPKAVYKEISLT